MIEKQLRLFDDEVQNAVFATLVLLVCFLSLSFLTFCFMAILFGAGKKHLCVAHNTNTTKLYF